MLNNTLFLITFYIYTLALVFSILFVVNKKKWVENTSFSIFALGFLLHTAALLVRWGEAGNVEVAAFQEAEGRILQGWDWFSVYISHPPWSNMYESLVCFGWGMVAVSLYGIKRFRVPFLPIFSIAVTLLIMGAASLLITKGITPLVPALQSKWIHLHVTMATISYPAFGLAAILAVFYLLKVGVRPQTFGVVTSVVAILIIMAVGGKSLLTDAEYRLPLLSNHAGEMFRATYEASDANGAVIAQDASLAWTIPVAGIFFWLSMLSGLAAVVLYALRGSRNNKIFRGLMLAGFAMLSIGIGAILASVFSTGELLLKEADIQSLIASSHLAGGKTLVENYIVSGTSPFMLSLKGAPFEFMLLVMAWMGFVFYLALEWKTEWLVAQLPDAEKLDNMSYKTILFAFPFLTLLIITGAVWAYYAWGRYWGWDPKETWSLVTWLIYSIYLHVRISHGWQGRIPAVLAALGFAIVIFTYLGVNILLSGLHSYGSG